LDDEALMKPSMADPFQISRAFSPRFGYSPPLVLSLAERDGSIGHADGSIG
jgi:hypothetical protein